VLCFFSFSEPAGNPEVHEQGEHKPHGAHKALDQHAALAELQRLAHDKMKNLLRTRTLRGFPLNIPFTDVEELLTRVSMPIRLLLLYLQGAFVRGFHHDSDVVFSWPPFPPLDCLVRMCAGEDYVRTRGKAPRGAVRHGGAGVSPVQQHPLAVGVPGHPRAHGTVKNVRV
jgi:hypothetical protein